MLHDKVSLSIPKLILPQTKPSLTYAKPKVGAFRHRFSSAFALLSPPDKNNENSIDNNEKMDENTMDTRINNAMDWERATNATMEDELFNYSASSSNNGTSLTPPNNTLLDLPPSLNATAPPQGMDSKNNDIWANLMAVGWIFVILYCCCCKRRVPSREHWRGDEIRRRYQEMLARERAKEEKEQQTPEYRHKLVQHNMRTKVSVD